MWILVAEDDNDSRIAMVNILQKQGYEVVESCDGVQAWNVIKDKGIPSLLVLDIMMPGMDDLDLCHKIRAAESSSPSYIILLIEERNKEEIDQ
ncbi:MAG TPA: response regulator, partial [Desulfohalobiaceae bacterium]|nr:response regulator [Desulfohalobiaceae bacterium]